MTEQSFITKESLAEIPAFETFLYKVGFKRNEGAIFGLLVLSDNPLSSDQIEQTLGLSQSSVSQVLKKLSHYGAVTTFENRDTDKRVKLHTVKEDSLAIVASLFRKREQETIEDFKRVAQRVLAQTSDPKSLKAKRLKSIVTTCELAESVMNFVIKLATKSNIGNYEEIIKKVPQALDLMSNSVEPITSLASNISKRSGQIFNHKITESLMKFAGDHHVSKK